MNPVKTYEQLLAENERLLRQLEEATDTIEAIRTGQVDALVVAGKDGHELYTLKTADQAYRVFIQTMNEGAITLSEEGLILYCNSTFANLVGVPLSQAIGLPFEAFVSPVSQEAFQQLFKRGWWETRKAELLIRSADGEVPCQLSVTALEMDEGVSLSVILTDLTAQKQTESLLKQNNERLAQMNAALEASNHDLLQFASVASHDLQEPLRKILIFSKLIQDRLGGDDAPPGLAVYLTKIIDSSKRMRTIITDILNYSKLSLHDTTSEPTDLRAVVDEVLSDFEVLIEEKKATVAVGDLPVLAVNRGQMRQVFHNLLSNALKFSKPDRPPRIEIAGSPASPEPAGAPPGRSCWITITDNGIGFNEQYAEKVFSLFHRLNTKDAYEGSGIGLAIAKRIIDKHGGTLTATSREGVGSVFRISLPLPQSPVDAP
jgi:two-component system CheB/CheR fusion protein